MEPISMHDTQELVGQFRLGLLWQHAKGGVIVGLILSCTALWVVLPAYDGYSDPGLGRSSTSKVPPSTPGFIVGATAGDGKGTARASPFPSSKAWARIHLSMDKPGVLWIDGHRVGRFKKTEISLAEGRHVLQARVGKRILTQRVTVNKRERFALFFHGGKGRVFSSRK